MDLDREALLKLYKTMTTIRHFEERGIPETGQRGMSASVHSSAGQEAVAVELRGIDVGLADPPLVRLAGQIGRCLRDQVIDADHRSGRLPPLERNGRAPLPAARAHRHSVPEEPLEL